MQGSLQVLPSRCHNLVIRDDWQGQLSGKVFRTLTFLNVIWGKAITKGHVSLNHSHEKIRKNNKRVRKKRRTRKEVDTKKLPGIYEASSPNLTSKKGGEHSKEIAILLFFT